MTEPYGLSGLRRSLASRRISLIARMSGGSEAVQARPVLPRRQLRHGAQVLLPDRGALLAQPLDHPDAAFGQAQGLGPVVGPDADAVLVRVGDDHGAEQ